jgi:hypothetical protein
MRVAADSGLTSNASSAARNFSPETKRSFSHRH